MTFNAPRQTKYTFRTNVSYGTDFVLLDNTHPSHFIVTKKDDFGKDQFIFKHINGQEVARLFFDEVNWHIRIGGADLTLGKWLFGEDG